MFCPGSLMRASAYAASVEVNSTPSTVAPDTIRLFAR